MKLKVGNKVVHKSRNIFFKIIGVGEIVDIKEDVDGVLYIVWWDGLGECVSHRNVRIKKYNPIKQTYIL